MRYVPLFLLLLLASPSWANWHVCGATGQVRNELFPKADQNAACYDFTATGTTQTLDTSRCNSVCISLFTDTSGSSGTAEAYVYSKSVADLTVTGGSTSGAEKILGDTDGDGLPNDVTLNGDPTALRFGLCDIAPAYILVDITAASTSYGRLMAKCSP